MTPAISYRTVCTGDALQTVEAHCKTPKEDEKGEALEFFGANFCPFVHRAWIALEILGVEYRYIEVDPYKKTKELLDVNPKGLVPALKIDKQGRCLGESTVIMEYLIDRYDVPSGKHLLLPKDAFLRAQHRLAADRVNRSLIPSFYRYLQAQEEDKQMKFGKEFVSELEAFTASMKEEKEGSFWDGSDRLGWADIMVAPWIFRANTVLRHYRGLQLEKVIEKEGRFSKWMEATLQHPSFKATTSTDDLYLDSYARYAENRPNTSQVANAINSGREFKGRTSIGVSTLY